MKKKLIASLPLIVPLAALTIGAPACDSASSQVADTVNDADVVDANDDAGADTAQRDTAEDDTATPDPCAEVACDSPPEARCELHRASLTVAGDGSCAVDDDGAPACEYATADEPCGEGGVCILDRCETVPSLCDFPFGARISGLTLFTLGGQSGEIDPDTGEPTDACCFVLDGDGTTDNAFGEIWKDLEPFFGTASDFFSALLGRAPTALDFHGVDSLEDDPAVDLIGYIGYPADGAIRPLALGFQPGTMLPPIAMAGRIEGGVFYADDGYYRFAIGVEGSQVFLEVSNLRAELALTEADDGSGQLAIGPVGDAPAGRISGTTSRADVFGAFNRGALQNCTCTTFGGDDDAPVIDMTTYACIPVTEQTCTESDAWCRYTTNPLYCEALVSLFDRDDVDTDGDGTDDAISVGFWILGEPTALVAPNGCE